MRSHSLFAALLVAVFACAPLHAAAQSGSNRDDEARTLFGLGQTAFEQARYRDSLEYFQRAYELSRRPQLLFNIGQVADRLRQDELALRSFEQYLDEVPSAGNRDVVEARIEILREAIASRTPAAPPTAEPAASASPEGVPLAPPPAAEAREGKSPVGLIVLGVGAAAVVAGAIVLGLGVADANTVENVADGTPWDDIRGEYDRAPTRITAGSVVLGLGAAACATGLVLSLGGGGDSEPTSPRAQLVVRPNGFVLRGSF